MEEINKKPSIRFAEFTDAWEQCKLGDIVQITMGQSPDGATYSDTQSDYILVQGNADLVDGWVSPRIWTTQKTKTCSAGDLIMSVRAPAGAMGKTAYNAVIGRGVASIKGNEFIFQQLSKMDNDGFWKKDSSGSTFESLNSDSIKNAEISLPRESEQIKIGELFNNLDHLITLHQRKCDRLSKVKKALLEKMFSSDGEYTPKIRFKGFTDAWKQRKLGDLGNFKSNGVDKLSKPDEIPVNLLNYMDVYKRRQLNNKMTSELMQVTAKPNQLIDNNVLKGDIFFTPTSETAADIGHCMAIEETLKNTVYSYHLMRYRPYEGSFYLTYSNYAFDTNEVRNKMALMAQGVQRFVLSKSQFESIEISYTKFEEQKKIAGFLTNIDHLITLHQRKCEKLKNLKKSLLEKMFI